MRRQVLLEDGVCLLGEDEVDPVRAGSDLCALSGGTVILNDISEHQPKSVLEVDKTSCNSQRASPKLLIADGDYQVPCESRKITSTPEDAVGGREN